jgi:hypothetical protein
MLIERRQAHIEISLGESQRYTAKTAIFLGVFFENIFCIIQYSVERTSHIGSNIENRYL